MTRPAAHLSHRSNWLRAAVLGANDGILSTASILLGVAASGASRGSIVTAGVAGMVAGACRWPPASTCRSAHSATRSRPTSRSRAGALRDPARRAARARGDLRASAGCRGARREVAARSPAATRSRRTRATSWPGRSAAGAAGAGRWTSALSFSAGAALPLLAVARGARAGAVPRRRRDADRARGCWATSGARLGGAPRRRARAPGRRLGRGGDGGHHGDRRARRRRSPDQATARLSGREQVRERRLDAARDDDHRALGGADQPAADAADEHGAQRAVAARARRASGRGVALRSPSCVGRVAREAARCSALTSLGQPGDDRVEAPPGRRARGPRAA